MDGWRWQKNEWGKKTGFSKAQYRVYGRNKLGEHANIEK
jgi:hypothetical protein